MDPNREGGYEESQGPAGETNQVQQKLCCVDLEGEDGKKKSASLACGQERTDLVYGRRRWLGVKVCRS